MSTDIHQTWYMHWYCKDQVWDCYKIMQWVISSFLTELAARDTSVIFRFRTITWVNINAVIFTKLAMCIDIVEICFGMFKGNFRQFLTMYDSRGVLSFLVFNRMDYTPQQFCFKFKWSILGYLPDTSPSKIFKKKKNMKGRLCVV